jgi:4Fe-4S ferredoxin
MEIEKEMDVEDSHIRCKQRTKETEKIWITITRNVQASICVTLCPKKALQEGPLQEIAKGMDAPPVLIDLESCVFCGMCVNFCPLRAFRMTVEDKAPEIVETTNTTTKTEAAET